MVESSVVLLYILNMKKKFRLHTNKEFENLFKQKKSFYTANLIIKAAKNDLDFSRVGIIVSTKVSKRAVDRNKVKRRIREIMRLLYNTVKPGFDILVIAKKPILEKNYQQIEEEVKKGLGFFKLKK